MYKGSMCNTKYGDHLSHGFHIIISHYYALSVPGVDIPARLSQFAKGHAAQIISSDRMFQV